MVALLRTELPCSALFPPTWVVTAAMREFLILSLVLLLKEYLGCRHRIDRMMMLHHIAAMPPRGTYSGKVTRHGCRRGAPMPALFSTLVASLAAIFQESIQKLYIYIDVVLNGSDIRKLGRH